MRVTPSTPVVALSMAEVPGAAMRARRAVDGAQDAATIEPTAAPFLHGAPLGRAFMAAPAPRALALAAPAEACHGAGFASGVADAARAALRRCLADGPPDCGCALVAVDDAVLAPPETLRYAASVGGRLLGPASPARGPLTVDEAPGAMPGEAVVAFRSAAGVVATGVLNDDGRAALVTADGDRFDGVRERRGRTRGRIVERLLLTAPDGARLIALIGFEPADVVAGGPALGAWPAP